METRSSGDLIVGRYRLEELLSEHDGRRFWRATDQVLRRHVAMHLLRADDPLADSLLAAARSSVRCMDRRVLRVLDADTDDGLTYVVNEWGSGSSLDTILGSGEPMEARRAAWLTMEVADSLAVAHRMGITHGRLIPENVLIDHHGGVRLIGLGVDAAMHGRVVGEETGVADDVYHLVGLLYAALTGYWPGVAPSVIEPAPRDHGALLRPRQVRAGIPRTLDALCAQALAPDSGWQADWVAAALLDFVGDPEEVALAEARRTDRPLTQVALLTAHDPPVREDVPAPKHAAPGGPGTTNPRARVAPERSERSEPPEPPVTTGSVEPAEHPTQMVPVDDQRTESWQWESPTAENPIDPALAAGSIGAAAGAATATGAGTAGTAESAGVAGGSGPTAVASRPLYAPAPPPGEPVRRPRPGLVDRTAPPVPPGPPTAAPGSPGSPGSPRAYATGAHPLPPGDGQQPRHSAPHSGRRWMLLAALIAILALGVVVFAVIRDVGGEGSDREAGGARLGTPHTIVGADDFDPPPGGNGEEHGDDVGNVLDDDPGTGWSTYTYKQQFGPGGLKDGVGLVLDLGREKKVGAVEVTVARPEVGITAYAADSPPESIDGLDEIASGKATSDRLVIRPEKPVGTRYVVLWLTSLPELGPGDFRGEITGVTVTS